MPQSAMTTGFDVHPLSEPKKPHTRKIQTLQRCQSAHSIAKDCRGENPDGGRHTALKDRNQTQDPMKLLVAFVLAAPVQPFAPPTRPLATRQVKQSAFLDDEEELLLL